MKGRLRVLLDGEERLVADGMTVRHLLTEEEAEAVRQGALRIVDEYGYERGLSGALLSGAKFFRRRT